MCVPGKKMGLCALTQSCVPYTIECLLLLKEKEGLGKNYNVKRGEMLYVERFQMLSRKPQQILLYLTNSIHLNQPSSVKQTIQPTKPNLQ
jgi:hypothetical protein